MTATVSRLPTAASSYIRVRRNGRWWLVELVTPYGSSNPITSRLARIPLLGTDKNGEIIGTVHAIRRTLESAGCDLHDLALVVERAALPVVVEQPRQEPEPKLPDWQELGRECLRRSCLRLSDSELDFLRSMATLPSKPSPRQWRRLSAIAMSLQVEMEVTA